MQKLTFALSLIALAVSSFLILNQPKAGISLPQGTAVFETSLQSRISSTDTSMTLVSNSIRGSETLSGFNCFTLDEGRSDSEFVCGDVSGTTVSNLERGLSFANGTTTVTSLKFAHRVGANVKITDFPLIQRMRNQAAGIETYPTLISYADSVLITAGSPTTTIATKYYVDNVAVAGASNADTSTKGIVEIATQTEAASSTAIGSTGAILALPASTATDTPNTATRASRILMSDLTGYLKQAWINLTANFAWTGTHTWIGSSAKIGIGTTTPYAPLSVVGEGVFSNITATSTSATSTLTNLVISSNASTTNLTVSNICHGCAANGLTYVTGTQVTIGTNSDADGSASCSAGYVVIAGGANASSTNSVYTVSSYPSSASTWSVHMKSVDNAGSEKFLPYAVCVRQ